MASYCNDSSELPFINCPSLLDLLRYRSLHQPERLAFTFLQDGETQEASLTYQELDQRSRAIASQLQSLDLSGERALLLYPPGLDYIAAFFGCLYAGVVAVPAYPPRNRRSLPRIEAIVSDAQAAIALTTDTILAKVKPLLSHKLDTLHWLTTNRLESGIESCWQQPKVSRETLAFLQYTSGSTGTPRGVMLSHGNLLHNAEMTYRFMEHSPASTFVSWLPTYHDMGLIGGVLQPLYGGFPCILMPPAAFLQRPYRWLWAISHYQGTTSGGPNFAYELCVQKITAQQRQTLDLSSWSVAFNGAEPIRQETLERFAAAFAPCGFRAQAFYPCYGLAEATLMVSGGCKATPPVLKTVQGAALERNQAVEAGAQSKDGLTLVSCGQTLLEQQIVIVQPETLTHCPPDEVGEIWVSGLSVGQGYWNQPEKTQQTFCVYLSDTGEGPFLRTGDLGFLHNGELFVTGRAKDLIIIRGRNLYPQDIELTVERSHPALRSGSGAAFSVEVAGEEHLVVVQELEFRQKPNSVEEITRAIRQAVAQEYEVQTYAVILLKAGSIPKTSSGKIQRRATRAEFLAGNLEIQGSSILDPCDSVENKNHLTRAALLETALEERQSLLISYLQQQIARVLRVAPSQVNPLQPISALGLDSLRVFELKNCLEVDLEVTLGVTDFFECSSVTQLATKVLDQLTTATHTPLVHLGRVQRTATEHPLSYAQQRLWFFHQLEPGTPAYNIPVAVRLTGQLNVTAIGQSINEIIRRHEVLRTSFRVVEGQPVQVIAPALTLNLPMVDLRSLPTTRHKAETQRLSVEEAKLPFNLLCAPLLRVTVLYLAEAEFVLLLTLHHIVSDGWSIGVLLEELVELYEAFSAGKNSSLPSLPIQYADFSDWQRQWLQNLVLESQLSYWKKQLGGNLPVLNLPTDYPRPAIQTFRGARQTWMLPKTLTEAIKVLSQGEGVTLFMTLLAAFKTLLYRYTAQEDILVGSPIASRNRSEVEKLIGFFVNTLVLRTDMSGNPSFRELLGRVRKVAIEAYVRQDLPFEKLVRELQPERDLSYAPLFQVMFALQNVPLPPLELSGLTLYVQEGDTETAKFDLTLLVQETVQELAVTLEYNTDLFNAATMTRMLGSFQTLLESIVADPEQHIKDLPLLKVAERYQLLVEWNNTQADYPKDTCIHQMFEAQVERTPDAPSVVFEDQQLSYQELNQRANQLAHYLQKLGVEPEVLVGICVERSVEMVVGLLGILKAGGAYVPLDPAYPQERLAFMLADARVPVLLTQQRLVEGLPEHVARVLCLDTDWQAIAQQSADNPLTQVRVEHLAYAIYTSGSTGKPKGAMNTHLGIGNRLLWMQDAYRLTLADSILQKTPLSFDVSVWEFFWPLLTGARLVVIRPYAHKDSAYLVRLIAQQQITTLHFVPSMLQVFLEEQGLETCKCIKRIITSGEALPFNLQRRCFTLLDAEVHNLYGPTEAAVDVTFWTCQRNSHQQMVPIGRPINNIQIYLLDDYLQPVPVGVPGELYIGGDGLARGYLNRPDLTALRFIPNPFSDSLSARLYKTGDLGRYLVDGNIQFLGRIDHQVKIRGFRIELGEIEAALGQHPDVRMSVVVAQEEETGNKCLVAYVLPAFESAPAISELRSFLKEKLPEYMVPATFVMLDALPLTPNGKVDRKALPATDKARPELETAFVAPRTLHEEILAGIWSQVLGVEHVGIYDNFFELGGDSILSMQVVSRANQAGFQLTAKQMFEYQTIAELAAIADTAKATQAEQGLVTGQVPLTPIQHWFFEQELPEEHHWNQAILLELPNALDPMLLEQVVQHLLEHHDALRLRFSRKESGLKQVNASPTQAVPFTRLDLSLLPASEQGIAIQAAAAELQASLNISAGRLVRVALFDRGDHKPYRLLIVIHHLAIDGVSWRILLEDLATAYEQLSRSERLQLPPKTTSFKHWAERLTEYAQSAKLQQERDYWLTQLQKPISRLPVDYPGGANTVASARTVSVALSVKETQALLQKVPAAYRTQINDVLLTALVQAFSQWTGIRSLLVDLEGHGREVIFEDVDLSRTLGWFTSIFPVLLNLREAHHPGDGLKLVKEQLRSIPNRGIGYGVLRYLSSNQEVAQQLRVLPQAEVSFNYLGQFDQVLPESSLFGQVQEFSRSARCPQGSRRHLLDVNGFVVGGQLRLDWTYSKEVHLHTTVERLAQGFVEALASLITHCQSPEAGGYTPSDFLAAKIGHKDFDKLLSKISQSSGKQFDVKVENLENIYELSPMQQGMLFHTLYAPKSGVYFEQFSFTLEGNLDVLAFKRAWQQVVARHPILRTAFYWEDLDKPYQVVHQRVELPWEQQDWRGLSAIEQEERLEAFLQADRHRGFELSQAPLMHLILLQLAEDAYQFVWSYHHILLDGWCASLLFKEINIFYKAFCQGQELNLERPRPYRDYIVWLQQQDLSVAEAFWRKMLKGFTTPTSVRVGQVPSSLVSQNDREQQIKLSTAATAALQSFVRQHHLTLNILVQGAWALLLSRYSGEEDIVFGVTSSGRPAALVGVESMMGLFINTLPMRVQVAPDRALLPWLKNFQTQQVEMRQYEYSPLVEIQRWSEVPPSAPLFQSIVVFENYPVDASLWEQGGNLEIRNVRYLERTNYPLTLVAVPDSELCLKISYDCRHFNTATITRMLGHLQTLLEGIVANPDRRLEDLPLLTEAERQTLLVEWNDTQVDYPQDKCIHQLFEAQVERTPDAVAVIFEDQQLSYQELNRRVNQLAHYLRELGVGPEVLVGLCLERSLEMVVGLLGILKAGGAYVPLDPAYPQERLAFMLSDAQVAVLLTQHWLVKSLPEHPALVVCQDTDWQAIGSTPSQKASPTGIASLAVQKSKENLASDVTADNLAYVMYTSGSTGKPKGVSVIHRSVVRLVKGSDYANLRSEEVFLQLAPISFDASTFEICGCLLNGGRLVVMPAHTPSLEELGQVVGRLQVTTLWLTSGLFHLMVDERLEDLKPVRQLLAGGDALSVPHIQKVLRELGDCKLLNGYGPTENTTFTCCYPITEPTQLGNSVPIGRPIANTQIYLLNAALQPVPIGVSGELYIGGHGLARGYLNRSELTAQRFIPNAFSDELGARLYKTGDLARYLPDGNIEFLGRIDNQVKIRGFRIELGEIEAVLSQHPTVRMSLILPWEEESGNKCLVAYVVPKQESAPTISELGSFLREKLPEYMVPSVFIMLESLPLTPNGKVNHYALPTPERLRLGVAATYVAPQTEIERLIAAVWQEKLQIEKVGIYDNFFELGGHSLFIVQIYSKLREIFESELSMVDLFKYPTISSLAKHLSQDRSQKPALRPSKDRIDKRRVNRDSINQQSQGRQKHRSQRK